MGWHHALLLFAAGIAGGTLSAVSGGAGLITFPALLAVGLTPVSAAASNLAAMTPGNFVAALGDRSYLPKLKRGFLTLVLASVLGACAGAVLLMLTPERTFEVLVPLLLGFATILFALSPRISASLRARAARRNEPPHEPRPAAFATLLPVSIYGGYFGAGVGVLLLGVMSISTGGDYRAANVIKNFVTSLNSFAAAALFAARGAVDWPPTLVMMIGGILGGFLGGLLARVIPRAVMRVVVIVVGVALTATYAARYWF